MKPHLSLLRRGTKKTPDKKRRQVIDYQRLALACGTVLILSILLSIHMLPSKVSLKLGEISDKSIYAHRTQRYVDTAETELKRAQAASVVGKVYDFVPNAQDQALGALETTFHTIQSVNKQHSNLPIDQKVILVRQQLGTVLGARISDSSIKLLFRITPE
ncbi:MAG: hypothetical protein SNJ70_07155, partial [Armatimonadota bacterium]